MFRWRNCSGEIAGLVAGCLMVFGASGCGSNAAQATPRSFEYPDPAALRDRIDKVLDITASRRLDPKVQNAWQIVHGILAFGRDLKLRIDGKDVSALDWLLAGNSLQSWKLVPGEKGLETIVEPGAKVGQGHEDQWLGYLSQCDMKLDDKIKAGGRVYTIKDMLTQAQWDVREGMEGTWTLMAFATYLPSDAHWITKQGKEWTLEQLVNMEAGQDINTSACGGSHRLYALAKALSEYRKSGGDFPANSGWAHARDRVNEAVKTCQEFQQPTGALSTNYWIRPATSPDIGERIGTTGHALEFLVQAMSDEQLQEAWVVKTVLFLVDQLEKTRSLSIECGGLYHASRGLMLYRQRRFGPRGASGA